MQPIQGFENGTGSSGSPWQICDCEMLQLTNNNSYNNDYFELTRDVDCSESTSWNNNGSMNLGFDPINTTQIYFDGNGNAYTGNDAGMFHGGDIKGMTDKIEEGYFDQIGVKAWFSPLALRRAGLKAYEKIGFSTQQVLPSRVFA